MDAKQDGKAEHWFYLLLTFAWKFDIFTSQSVDNQLVVYLETQIVEIIGFWLFPLHQKLIFSKVGFVKKKKKTLKESKENIRKEMKTN